MSPEANDPIKDSQPEIVDTKAQQEEPAEPAASEKPVPTPKTADHSVAKTFGLVAVLTVLSKFAGLIRDIVVAKEYGTSVIADAYNYAYLFTGNVLVLFGGLGGPFHSSTVAVVTPQRENRESGLLITQILVLTFLVLSVITLAIYALAPYLVGAIASHYHPGVPAIAHSAAGQASIEAMNQILLNSNQLLFKQQMLEQLTIMLPLVVIAGVIGVSYGVLNVYNKIFWPSLSPAIASLAIIVAIWCTDPGTRLVWGIPLAVGTLAGAIGQLIAQVPAMAKLELNWKFTFQPQPGLVEYLKMLWPAVFSTSVGQLTVYIDSMFALMLDQGAWTAIVNSNRLVQLPLGILLTAMLVPMLPRFTQQASANKPDDLKSELRRALRVLWFLALPMSAILLAIPRQIIEVLFQRGNFDANSTGLVTLALIWLVPSIVFYVARDLMTRVFYAYQDSKTPYKVAVLAILIKAPLDYLMILQMQSVAGISLATTLITVFNLSMLTWFLRRKIGNLGFARLVQPLAIMLAATAVCGVLTWGTYTALSTLMGAALHAFAYGTILKLGTIAVSSLVGITVYVGVCMMCRLEEPLLLAKRVPFVRNYVK